MTENQKVTSNHCPAIMIEDGTVCFIFNENELVDYPYNNNKKMMVVKEETYNQWIKDNYNDLE